MPTGLAFSMEDGRGVDEDAEDIGLTPRSSTIGIRSLDDSDDESSEFDAFRCIGRGSRRVDVW